MLHPGAGKSAHCALDGGSAALHAAAALTATGCGPVQACPAMGYSSVVVVRLDDWPAGAGRKAELTCPGCGFALYGAQPDQVTVRVLEGGVVVAEVTAEPEFVRVDGTAECGGSTEAEVVVPAP